VRIIACVLALIAALAAGAMAATSSTRPLHTPAFVGGGGFGRGYGPFHTYGWARGMAGYEPGSCYWHPGGACEAEDN